MIETDIRMCTSGLCAALASLSLLAACSRDREPEVPPVIPPVDGIATAYTETFSSETKTSFDVIESQVNWSPADSILIYYRNADGSAGSVWARQSSASSGTCASFAYTLPGTAEKDTLYAAYNPVGTGNPFLSDAEVHFGTVQNAPTGSADNNSAPMVARWTASGDDSPVFHFKNAFSLLAFSLANRLGDTADSLVINLGEGKYGDCRWSFDADGNPVIKAAGAYSSVTVKGPFAESGTYHVAVPPGLLDRENFSIDLYSGGEVKKKFKTGTVSELARNSIVDAGSYSTFGTPFGTS